MKTLDFVEIPKDGKEWGDWKIGSVLSGIDAVKKRTTSVVKIKLGEAIYDLDNGIDFDLYLGYPITENRKEILANEVASQIQRVAEVDSIQEIDITEEKNKLIFNIKLLLKNKNLLNTTIEV